MNKKTYQNYKSDYNEELINSVITLDMFDVKTNEYKTCSNYIGR